MIILKKKLFSSAKEMMKAMRRTNDAKLGKQILDSGNKSAQRLLEKSIKEGKSVNNTLIQIGRKANREIVGAAQPGVHRTINDSAYRASYASLRNTPVGVGRGVLGRQKDLLHKQAKKFKVPEFDHVKSDANMTRRLKSRLVDNKFSKELGLGAQNPKNIVL